MREEVKRGKLPGCATQPANVQTVDQATNLRCCFPPLTRRSSHLLRHRL